jgi:Flp pilus assembly secretin CpaC
MILKTQQILAVAALAIFGALNTPTLQAQAHGQTQANPSAPSESSAGDAPVSIKLLITLTEYDGATKISSLPYTIPIVVQKVPTVASVRVGARVPISAETSKDGKDTISYIDVGTNIDVLTSTTSDGRYSLTITVDRSSMYVPFRDKDGAIHTKDWASGEAPPSSSQPMIRQFRAHVVYLLRDGQPSEITSTTDPLSGHVLKLEAVATALK